MGLDVVDVARSSPLTPCRMPPAPGLALQLLSAELPPRGRAVKHSPRLFGPAFGIVTPVALAPSAQIANRVLNECLRSDQWKIEPFTLNILRAEMILEGAFDPARDAAPREPPEAMHPQAIEVGDL
jgi:hypothetical protein